MKYRAQRIDQQIKIQGFRVEINRKPFKMPGCKKVTLRQWITGMEKIPGSIYHGGTRSR
jgi:hypothetical protein